MMMRWLGILILCCVASFILIMLADTKEFSRGVVVVTFMTVTVILLALTAAVLFGISLIIHG